MTNKDYLLSNDRILADKLIHKTSEPDYDYDYDDNLYECGTIECYVCPDGVSFGGYGCLSKADYEDAVQHTMEWFYEEKEYEDL